MSNPKTMNSRMYLVYKWFQFFFQALADMFESCARIGLAATLRAEYFPTDQESVLLEQNSDRSEGS